MGLLHFVKKKLTSMTSNQKSAAIDETTAALKDKDHLNGTSSILVGFDGCNDLSFPCSKRCCLPLFLTLQSLLLLSHLHHKHNHHHHHHHHHHQHHHQHLLALPHIRMGQAFQDRLDRRAIRHILFFFVTFFGRIFLIHLLRLLFCLGRSFAGSGVVEHRHF